MDNTTEFLSRHYPEVNAGGYTAVDGTVEFYSRINALLDAESRVLDYGAGRAAWYEDASGGYKRSLRLLKGKVREIIACDIDPVVTENRTADQAVVLQPGENLPFEDDYFDMIVADYVFEHVEDPELLRLEFDRILKRGGWIAARTPCKYNYVALGARAVPNRRHGRWLSVIQPSRKEQDVFPTRYRLNSMRAIRQVFPADQYENWTYYYSAEPSYHFNKSALLRLLRFFEWISPRQLYANLFVFLKKK